MAKDTEKLIRQLSLISYLMAERRPVTALEIRRDVEGYSGMNEDAFARRFYADRSELDSLGIQLTVEKPMDGVAEQENYSLRPENFHLPAIEFTDRELASLQTALTLLDGEFAYAEPLRLALQQITWGRPSPLRAPDQSSVALGVTASAGGHELSQRLAKIETAIFRHKTITFDYYTMERDEIGPRKVDPYHLLFRDNQFYLLGHSHERGALRVFRLSRIRGKVSYATKAEHDFRRPADFDPREYTGKAGWQLGETAGTAHIRVAERIAWHVERNYGEYGTIERQEDGSVLFTTDYSSDRQLASWVLRYGGNVTVLSPESLTRTVADRVQLLAERHAGAAPDLPDRVGRRHNGQRPEEEDPAPANGKRETPIRPERFARLVTLASVLIEAGRSGQMLEVTDVCERLQVSEPELREDINVLNVVNFGGGTYLMYAELRDDGTIEVDPEPYADSFARPARLLPVEAKALVAAIDFLGDRLSEGALTDARAKIVEALGDDPMQQGLQVAPGLGEDADIARTLGRAIDRRRIVKLEYYKANEDELSERTVEPYRLSRGQEGWYVEAFDVDKDSPRHFRLDRIKTAVVTDEKFEPREGVDMSSDVEEWMRTGELADSRTARVLISPDRARWAHEQMTVTDEFSDGSVVVDLPFAGTDFLVRRVLEEAGDATVLEPADAREAVRDAVAKLR